MTSDCFQFRTQIPNENLQMRQAIFDGAVYLTHGGHYSRLLVNEVIDAMREKLQIEDIRKAHLQHSDEELFNRFGDLRRTFYLEPHFQNRLVQVAGESGFSPDRIRFDPIRIRVVLPGGHHNPKAAPVYYPHRDTWYAHPQSLIVWWIPLHDLRAEETFEFFPADFDREVGNDSEVFDYSQWVKDGPALKIGWQDRQSGIEARYPQALQLPDRTGANAHGFSCRAADNLIFAGAHFHQTLEQDLDTIRYSLDFRIVDLDDIEANRGAPNADNRSRGSTLQDYLSAQSM